MKPSSKKQMGKRIRLARQMAGLTQEQLIKKVLNSRGNKSTVSNWENGRHCPDRRQIESIACVTGTSPSWIERGHGPISTENRSVQAIRHQNLSFRWHELTFSEMRVPSHYEHLSEEQILAYLCDPETTIPDEAAREFEQAIGKPGGWMDEQHVENDPVLSALPEEAREILDIYSELPKKYREFLVSSIRNMKSGFEKLEEEE